ncbi:MAG TPA: hypothetical protein VFV53_01625 [Candidatus Limnocylindrales bacterium]|nr:hypothetical protein [Candidatus Limnocylindrales bacterium]
MPDCKRSTIVLAALLLGLSACGGGSATNGPTSDSTQGAASIAPTDAGPSDDAPSDAPGETPAASVAGGGGGGGGAGDACALVTADEAGGVLGISGVTTELTPGDFSYCFYRDSAGDAVIASTYMGRGGAGTFAVWKAGAGVQQVDAIGDEAIFDPSTATLFVLKGDAILGIAAGISSDSEAQRLDWAKALAEIATGRM